ncbi:MAG: hypothetical protein P4L83_02455 [Nevskia sp.]|nr:hypothetical protein [Nevskia sp.]
MSPHAASMLEPDDEMVELRLTRGDARVLLGLAKDLRAASRVKRRLKIWCLTFAAAIGALAGVAEIWSAFHRSV